MVIAIIILAFALLASLATIGSLIEARDEAQGRLKIAQKDIKRLTEQKREAFATGVAHERTRLLDNVAPKRTGLARVWLERKVADPDDEALMLPPPPRSPYRGSFTP